MPVSRISSIQWLWDPGLLHLWCHWESNHLPTDWAWTLRTQSPLTVKLCWLWYFTVIISISLFFHSYSRKANGLIVHYRNFPKAIQQFNGKYQQIQVKYQHDLSFFFYSFTSKSLPCCFHQPWTIELWLWGGLFYGSKQWTWFFLINRCFGDEWAVSFFNRTIIIHWFHAGKGEEESRRQPDIIQASDWKWYIIFTHIAFARIQSYGNNFLAEDARKYCLPGVMEEQVV